MKDARACLFDDIWQGEMPKFVATSHGFMVKKSSRVNYNDRTLFSRSLEIMGFLEESSQNGRKFQVSELIQFTQRCDESSPGILKAFFEQRLTRSPTLAAKRTFRMPGLLEGDNGTIIDGAWAAKHAEINGNHAVFLPRNPSSRWFLGDVFRTSHQRDRKV